jgi:NAD(P)-dependent dehydrogenase (short-subunit alcohol dehydrogenase family)
LARDGAIVVAHYAQNHSAAREVLEEISSDGGRCITIAADLRSHRGIERFFQTLDDELQRATGGREFDVLVNNAGIALEAPIGDTAESAFDDVFSINVKAPFFVAQHALARLRDGGRIINLSSALSRFASPSHVAYSMTKGAIDTMTRVLARELGPRGITVNAIAPGIIDTDMNAAWLQTADGAAVASSVAALGRAGRPSEVADVAAFLASADGGWVTGTYVDVSGGSLLGTG